MEDPRVRPKRRSRSPERRNNRDPDEFGNDLGIEMEDYKTEITQLDAKIAQQERDIDTKLAYIAESKTKSKERVADYFAQLRQLLETKEREALDEVDTHFDNIRSPLLEDSVVNVTSDKSRSNAMIRNNVGALSTSNRDIDIESLRCLKRGVIKRDQILNADFENKITLNEDVLEIVQTWKCISDNSGNNDTTTGAVENAITSIGINSQPALESERDERLQDDVEGYSSTEESETTQEVTHNQGVIQTHHGEHLGRDIEGATANITDNTQPSAPAMSTLSSFNQDEEEDPPPYWQAIGLSGPQGDAQITNIPNIPDLNTRTYLDAAPSYHDVSPGIPESRSPLKPCNKLEFWHSFPSKRQLDHRLTLPVSLTWNHGIICLGDRSNRKVKFFNASGDIFGQMLFNAEIHDVAFLERCNNESRYIVSLAKAFTFCIISLKSDNSTKLVRSILLKNTKPYNCISRGPREQTLVGGSGLPSNEPPAVDVIDFGGNVIQSFKFTPNYVPFVYPKSVYVMNQFIIISDWTLNVVCVFLSNGSPVGQYTGTPSCPLTDPLDITLDHLGNVLILDGHLPNIHVIDLKCTPIEIIKLPLASTEARATKLVAFDTENKMFATIKKNGQLAIYSFRGAYEGVPQGSMMVTEVERQVPSVLPLVEGMLPSTIEGIRSRSRPRGRTGLYHL